jgi:hypothetical protein
MVTVTSDAAIRGHIDNVVNELNQLRSKLDQNSGLELRRSLTDALLNGEGGGSAWLWNTIIKNTSELAKDKAALSEQATELQVEINDLQSLNTRLGAKGKLDNDAINELKATVSNERSRIRELEDRMKEYPYKDRELLDELQHIIPANTSGGLADNARLLVERAHTSKLHAENLERTLRYRDERIQTLMEMLQRNDEQQDAFIQRMRRLIIHIRNYGSKHIFPSVIARWIDLTLNEDQDWPVTFDDSNENMQPNTYDGDNTVTTTPSEPTPAETTPCFSVRATEEIAKIVGNSLRSLYIEKNAYGNYVIKYPVTGE